MAGAGEQGASFKASNSRSRNLLDVHGLSPAFMRSGGIEKVARDWRKTSQEGNITQALKRRSWAKELFRLTAASRAACQGGSSSSSTVCQAKASRLRAASVIARNLWPWPKLCSSS